MGDTAGAWGEAMRRDVGCELTVIIPTYNRCGLLKRALEGLLRQTARAESYEIVVVDDGSTDDTAAVVEGVRAPAGRLRYLRQENKGPAAARNLGAREARGKIVLFTGDDCLPDDGLIEEHLRAHGESGDVGVVGHVTWHPELEITPFMAFLEEGAQFGFREIEDAENVGPWHFYTANCSVQRHWIQAAGGFDEDFKHAAFEDVELAYRMQREGLRIVYRPSARTYHHHETTLERHLVRQRLCGRAAAQFYRKHPERGGALGADDYYAEVLRGGLGIRVRARGSGRADGRGAAAGGQAEGAVGGRGAGGGEARVGAGGVWGDRPR